MCSADLIYGYLEIDLCRNFVEKNMWICGYLEIDLCRNFVEKNMWIPVDRHVQELCGKEQESAYEVTKEWRQKIHGH